MKERELRQQLLDILNGGLWHTTINEYLSKSGLKENRGTPRLTR